MELPAKKRLVLGSNSPRRRDLMEALRLPFTVDAETSFIETIPPDTPHERIPSCMSEGKSVGFHRPLAEDEILVTADTLVLCGEEVLGKPRDRKDANRMLHLLSGRSHHVITAVTLRDTHRMHTFSVSTEVRFGTLTDEMIEWYVDHCAPLDKAGAYGIQEWIGYVGIRGIDGSYWNVVGFPTHRFYQELLAFIGTETA